MAGKTGTGFEIDGQEPRILLAGLPGNMATLMLNRLRDQGYNLADEIRLGRRNAIAGPIVLTGEEHHDEQIDEEFKEDYREKEGVFLATPEQHKRVIEKSKKRHGDNLFGINFANKKGYNVNFMFAENKIPFISGITGIPEERESKLVQAVNDAKIPAVIDKNMHPALVVFGAMLNYVQEKFPNALEDWGGVGVESHQASKSDPMSGTLGKWADYIRGLGVDFTTRNGGRNIEAGHGDHYISLRSPEANTRINLSTEVTGRESYAKGTVNCATPFLIDKTRRGETGVYDMIDVLGDQD